MKFKEIEIVTGASWFGSYNVIASYHDYYDEHRDMIEKICSTGWCEDYSEDHCNCLSSNQSCLLHDLFIKSGKNE